MKKIFLIISLLALFYTMDVSALDKSVFTVSSINANPGDEVTISINLNNSSKYNTIGMFIPLNTLMVEYVSCKINGFSDASMKNCGYNPKNEVTFYALQADGDLLNDNGNILDIKLKVKENITEDIPLSIRINSFDKNSEKLEYDIISGVIKLNGEVKTTSVDSKEELGKEVDGEVEWSSTNDDVAKVDSNGNVSFKEIGNTTIVAKDKNGKTVYEKSYQVNKKEKFSIIKYLIIVAILLAIIGIIYVIIIAIIKKKK